MNGNPISHHQMGGGDKEAEGDRRLRPWQASSSSRIYRVSRATGGKDRHSKVITAKGLRDRRVRLSVPTAIQFYDLQDRLGLDQPSKAVEWLINAASAAISELPSLDPSSFPHPDDAVAETKNSACSSSASGSSKGSVLYLSQPNAKEGDAAGGGKQSHGGGGSFTELLKPAISTADYFGGEGFLGQMEKAQNHPHQQLQPGCSSFLQEHAARDSGGGGGGLNFSIASSDLLHGLNRGTLQSNLASHFPHGHYHSDHHHHGHHVPASGVDLPFFVGHAVTAAAGSSQECQFPRGQLYYSNGYWMHSDIKGEGKD